MFKNLVKYFLILVLIAFGGIAFAAGDTLPKNYKDPEINLADEELKTIIKKSLKQYINSLTEYDLENRERLVTLEQDTIRKTLESEGYYRSIVTYRIAEDGELNFNIEKGKPYRITSVIIKSEESVKKPEISTLKAHTNNIIKAQDVKDDIKSINDFIAANNCIAELKTEYTALLDDDNGTIELTYNVTGLNDYYIGDISISGLETINEPYIRKNISLHKGDCYSTLKVNKSKIDLYQTGLFSTVDLEQNYATPGRADIKYIFKEKAQRTVKAGAGYNLDEGLYLTSGWEHRNYFHNGEKLSVSGKVSSITQQAEAKLTIPSFTKNNSLTIGSELKQEDLDSYKASSITGGVTLQRKFSNKLDLSHGPKFIFSTVEKDNDTENYAFVLYQTILLLDKRDNVLDPQKGYNISLEVDPYINTLNTDDRFLKNIAKANYYHTLEDVTYKPTFAAKAGAGSIIGLSKQDLPPDQRFYVGGGGSVRGYEYQTLGPIVNNEPFGGRSFTEFGVETRLRFTEEWGGAIFLDGGEAFSANYPQFFKNMHYAYGIGARYYTSFAPIRLDLAFPVNPRPQDDAFQFYISIGQAF